MIKLLKEARAKADGVNIRSMMENDIERSCFNPKAALFVFNHWDRVVANTTTPEELETTKQLGLQRLQEAWPDVDVESQVFFISVKEVS